MMANKRNMLLESIAILFLVTRSDVSHPRQTTSECNEHTYGFWQMLLKEFNMEQLIRIVEKADIKLSAIFKAGLVTARTKTSFKGYQQTFPDFLASLQDGSDGALAGPVDVDLDKKAVDQLWDEVKGVIGMSNAWMVQFLKIFGVVEGNGLSPFVTSIDSPSDLSALIDRFFRPAKSDTRGNKALSDISAIVENGDGVEDLNEELGVEAEEAGGTGAPTVSADVVAAHVTEIQHAENNDNVDDGTVVQDVPTLPAGEAEIECLFDSGDSQEAYYHFKLLLTCNGIGDVGNASLKVVQLLQLGKLEKGSVTLDAKHNSRNGRWFSQKAAAVHSGTSEVGGGDNAGLYIMRDSLVHIKCKRGKS